MNEEEPQRVTGTIHYDEDWEDWIVILKGWEPPAGLRADDWVEVTIRRYEFQP